MPNITEYNAPNAKIQPSDLPERALQLAARRSGTLGNEQAGLMRQTGELERQTANLYAKGTEAVGKNVETLGQVVEQHATQQEILSGMNRMADLTDQLDTLHKTMVDQADPFDPNVGQNYRQAVAEVLHEFPNSFQTPGGKLWATRHAANLETEMYRHSVAEDMTRSQEMARLGLIETTNKLSNLAARNPGMIDAAIGMVGGSLDALAQTNPALKGIAGLEAANEMKRQIVISGLSTAIETNPQAGLALASSDKYDGILSPADRAKLGVLAQHAVKFNDAIGKAQITAQNHAQDQRVKAATDALLNSTVTATGPRLPGDYWNNLGEIAKLPGSERNEAALRAATSYGQRLQAAADKETKTGQRDMALNTTNPGILDNVLTTASTGALSHGQILGMAGKGLSAADAQWLSTQVSDDQRADLGKLKAMLDGAKLFILGGDPASYTAQGMANYGRAQAVAIMNFRRGRDAGVETSDLLDPKSKSFILPHIENYGQNAATLPPRLNVEGQHFLHPFHMPPMIEPPGEGGGQGGGQNNPGNLRVPGSTGTSPQSFQSFPDIDSGIRAVSQQLQRYAARGINTVRGIISTYSPPNENDTPRLIRNAAALLGVDPDDKLDMHDPAVLGSMTQAIVTQEGHRMSLAKIFSAEHE